MSKFKQTFLTRQFDIIPAAKQGVSIIIVGAGAVGSFTALALAKMGYGNITVYDFDTISEENMNCQFYRVSDIGQKKVAALESLIKDFTGLVIKAVDAELGSRTPVSADIVITAVDSMKVRKMLAETARFKYLIDPRMGAEYASMTVITPPDLPKYLKHLYTDEEAQAERCTAKSTMYTVNLIAGQVAKVVKDITVEQPYIKNFDWAIAQNSLVAFNSIGVKL